MQKQLNRNTDKLPVRYRRAACFFTQGGSKMQASQIIILITAALIMFGVIGLLSLLAHCYTLNGIKSKTVGDGQHGTARWATKSEIKRTYTEIPYEPEKWRKGETLPKAQGLIVGWRKASLFDRAALHGYALVDDDDIHCLMIGAAGVGKTAHFLYPNLEYACASGMSFITTDTKGDLYRNYAGIAKDHYGYDVAVIDLRNPTRSDATTDPSGQPLHGRLSRKPQQPGVQGPC
jgi:type IV secretion system protein VirD4